VSRRLRTAAPAAVLAAVLALSGCLAQPEEANDNGPQPDPTQPGDVVRTPAPVESAPSTVPLPGATNSPNVEGDVSASASPS
jgi:PBP1b-binding outer membrane lipoprotein LpoB